MCKSYVCKSLSLIKEREGPGPDCTGSKILKNVSLYSILYSATSRINSLQTLKNLNL